MLVLLLLKANDPKVKIIMIVEVKSGKQKKEKKSLYEKRQEIYLIYDGYILSKNNKSQQQTVIKKKLVDLMHEFNVGVQIKSVYEVKQLDEDFFEEQ